MKITSLQAVTPSPASIASQIAALQKQLAGLQKQLVSALKEVPSAEEKDLADMRVKNLQLQITSIETEISRLSQMAAAPELRDAQPTRQDSGDIKSGQQQRHPTASASGNVDLYV
jgi:chromosome segregation ATPase